MSIAMGVAGSIYMIITLCVIYRNLQRNRINWVKSYLPISAVCYVLLLVSLFIYYS